MLTTVVLHFATALATIVVFRADLSRLVRGIWSGRGEEGRRFIWTILISMVAAVIVVLAFESHIAQMFLGQFLLVGFSLLITGGLLVLVDRLLTTDRYVCPDYELVNGY